MTGKVLQKLKAMGVEDINDMTPATMSRLLYPGEP